MRALFIRGLWPSVSGLGFLLFTLAISLPFRASASSEAPASPTQAEVMGVLDLEIQRFASLLEEISDESYKAFVTGVIDGFRTDAKTLSGAFDQTRYDEVRLKVLVEYQRTLAWLQPPKVLPRSPYAPALSTSSAETSARVLPTVFAPSGSEPDALAGEGFSTREQFLEQHCIHCHDNLEMKGGLDLTSTNLDLNDPTNFALWVKVHDQVRSGSMPPKKRKRPEPAARDAFLAGLSTALTSAETAVVAREGRSMQRRLNAYEYENALRDLFHVPWLQIKGSLPDDGIAHRFNKSGKALDISHVQLSRFMSLADTAIREAIAVEATRPPSTTRRFYAREQKFLRKEFRLVVMNTSPDRQNFPLLGTKTEVDVRWGDAPHTVGDADPAKRELEAVGWVGIAFPKWDRTPIPVAGRYRLRFSGYTIWVGGNGYSGLFKRDDTEKIRKATRWHLANVDDVSEGRRDEPVSIYAEAAGQSRRLGGFDLTPEPRVHEMEVWLGVNESVMPRATRLFQPRPPQPTNPNAQRDGVPGVAFRWIEIEGPLADESTTAGYRLVFGDLPLTEFSDGGKRIVVQSAQPKQDAERLLRTFLNRAWPRPPEEEDVAELFALIGAQLDAGMGFADAMIVGYTAALTAPGFLMLHSAPGTLDDYALATRLALFLWNSPADAQLRSLAAEGRLQDPGVLQRETERLLSDTKANRFVDAFLDYWLDLRRMEETSPSISLYNDYYLDDALVEAAMAESRLAFAEMLRRDLPARQVVASDFTFLNERLAQHYGIPGVSGIAMRRVTLPAGSPRGGFLTQASVLKVTANGTTTSPVLRGKWITERILGYELPPPPPVAAVEPDIRGAVTIRQQLEKHREDASCASCHSRMDPPGFALENFDIFGGWRDHYRAIAPGKTPVRGFGKNGAPYEFHQGLPVDAAGELPDGGSFHDIREFKRLLLDGDENEAQIARSLVQQLIIFGTGTPVRFTDRPEVERILQAAKPHGYGVRTLIHAIVQSDLFRRK